MKTIRIILLILIIIGLALLITQKLWVPGLVNRILESQQQTSSETLTGPANQGATNQSSQSTTTSAGVIYKNSEYGFNFLLPADWLGYSIIDETWNGYGNTQPGTVATGTELVIRNPKWTASDHYEDIPVLIFTSAQWKAYQANDFSVSPAPFPASELGANNEYVFAIPPRWDYDYSTGYQEADAIVNSNPLKPFNL